MKKAKPRKPPPYRGFGDDTMVPEMGSGGTPVVSIYLNASMETREAERVAEWLLKFAAWARAREVK